MSEQYLWDGSGPPDPEVARLERKLASQRWRGALPELEGLPGQTRRRWLPAALAAGVLLAAGAVWWRAARPTPAAVPSYVLEAMAGAPQIVGGGPGLNPGQSVVTDENARARLHVGDIGDVVLEPGSRLRVEEPVGPGAGYQLFLERGTLAATIFAAPRLFQVGTPAGVAVDLGCAYTATVQEDGTTLLRVTSGLVSFETPQRQVVVPPSASTTAYPWGGPATPVWDDAPQAWREAVQLVDMGGGKGGGAELRAALAEVLDGSREKDSLTLWHFLQNPDPVVRSAAGARLAELAPPPDGVSLQACLDGDRAAQERWRDSFGWYW